MRVDVLGPWAAEIEPQASHRSGPDRPVEAPAADLVSPANTSRRKRSHRLLRRLALIGLLLLGLAIGARAALPTLVRNYVNQTLDRSPLYAGKIGDIRLHLWRGAYSIEDVRVSKRLGSVPVPLFAAQRVDFAIQWNALLHGRIVGRIVMTAPELNFVDAPTSEGDQTGAGGPWLGMLQELFPFQINQAILKDGSIHFRAYWTPEPFDIYLSDVQATIDNLGNISDETALLISTVQAEGLVMDQAPFDFRMTLDPFSYRPTFHLTARILGLDVTRLNPLARAYSHLDFKSGWFDLVIDVDSKEGIMDGYAKPLFRAQQARAVTLSKPPLFAVLLLLTATGCIGGKQKAEQDKFFTLGSREADQRASQRMTRSEQLSGSSEDSDTTTSIQGQPVPRDEDTLTLFSRLGGEPGIAGDPAFYEGKQLTDSHATLRITNPEFDAVIGDLKASLDLRQVPAREQKELLAIVESTRPQIVTER